MGFDPMKDGSMSTTTGLVKTQAHGQSDDEKKVQHLEEGVQSLLDESVKYAGAREFGKALERAQEAGRAERAVIRFRESHNLLESVSLDLTFQCCLNLGLQYENNEMYSEALNAYRALTQNKKFENVGRIKVNMG